MYLTLKFFYRLYEKFLYNEFWIYNLNFKIRDSKTTPRYWFCPT